jgi:hypothetical protein
MEIDGRVGLYIHIRGSWFLNLRCSVTPTGRWPWPWPALSNSSRSRSRLGLCAQTSPTWHVGVGGMGHVPIQQLCTERSALARTSLEIGDLDLRFGEANGGSIAMPIDLYLSLVTCLVLVLVQLHARQSFTEVAALSVFF